MILADGDIAQYKELKKCNLAEYLIKLDNFVSRIEAQDTKGKIVMPTAPIRNKKK